MAKRLNGYTTAELVLGAQMETLDFPVGTVAVPTDDPAALFFFLGDGGRLLSSSEGAIPTSFLSLIDTPTAYGVGSRVVRVNELSSALEFVDAIDALPDLAENALWVGGGSDRAAPLSAGTEGQFLTVSGGDTVWATVAPGAGAATFLDLTDTPGVFGDPDDTASINASGDGLEFKSREDAQPSLLRGGLFVGNSSSRPTSLSPGTVGQILSTDGVDATWQDPAPAGAQTLPELDDVNDASPSNGQGYVYDPDGLGASQPGFLLSDFLATNLTGQAYDANRILQSNGSEYVDVLVTTLPEPNAEGVLWCWDDTLNQTSEVAPGDGGEVLTGNTGALPTFQPLATLVDDLGLGVFADTDQVLTGSRSVDLNGFNLSFAEGSNFSSTYFTANKKWVTTARGTLASDLIQISIDGGNDDGHLDIGVAGNATMRLWDGVSTFEDGVAGQFIGHDARWTEPFLMTDSTAAQPVKASALNVDSPGDIGVNWDYKTHVTGTGESGHFFAYVGTPALAASLEYPITTSGNTYWHVTLLIGGDLLIAPSTHVLERAHNMVRMTLMSATPREFIRIVSNGTWQGWREITTTAATGS